MGTFVGARFIVLCEVFGPINLDLFVVKLDQRVFYHSSLRYFFSSKDRFQRVDVDNTSSALGETIAGLPHCSILGTLLINIYLKYILLGNSDNFNEMY